MDHPEQIISTLEQEIIIMTLTTIVRLFDLGADAATLYLFYCKTAKLQSQQIGYTNKIKATSDYCRLGLHWGSDKFHAAKHILLENGFIENVVRRDKMGSAEGHYIQVNYLMKNSSYTSHTSHSTETREVALTNHFPQNPLVGNEGTNAANEKISADNKLTNVTIESYSEQQEIQKERKKAEKSYSNNQSHSISPLMYNRTAIGIVGGKQGIDKFSNYAKQAKYAKMLREAGITLEQIEYAVNRMLEDDFWKQRTFDMLNVYNNIHKYINQPKRNAEEEAEYKLFHPWENSQLVELAQKLQEKGKL